MKLHPLTLFDPFKITVWGGVCFFLLTGCGCGPSNQKISGTLTVDFSKPLVAKSGKRFGDNRWLTFELYRQGTFLIDGKSGVAWQRSESYRDSAIIRSAVPLPRTYKVSAVVGEVDYELEAAEEVEPDPDYTEGPGGENGCYLLAITDVLPAGHHTNDWWHKHRKMVIDVDNNVWGSGMPHPIFMVYFDGKNELVSWDGEKDAWQRAWKKAVEYDKRAWYRVEVERTQTHYVLSVYDEAGAVLKQGRVALADVWHAGPDYPDYLVIGDPHENYYQGSMKIKSIRLWTP